MSDQTFVLERRADGVVRLTLSRPAIHNAFDDRQIAELTAAFGALARDDAVRAVVLTGAGRSFSAGAVPSGARSSGRSASSRSSPCSISWACRRRCVTASRV